MVLLHNKYPGRNYDKIQEEIIIIRQEFSTQRSLTDLSYVGEEGILKLFKMTIKIVNIAIINGLFYLIIHIFYLLYMFYITTPKKPSEI